MEQHGLGTLDTGGYIHVVLTAFYLDRFRQSNTPRIDCMDRKPVTPEANHGR